MKTTNTTTNRTAEELYTEAEKAVFIALRARHEKSGLQFLTDLQNAQSNDRRARNNTAIAEQLAEAEAMHESHRNGVDFFTARANRLTLTDIERAIAQSIAEDLRNKAEAERKHIADLYDALDLTLSDRADLTQIAVITILETDRKPAPITDKILSKYKVTAIKDLTDRQREEAQSRANFRAVINAVGRAINTLASPEALNRTTTKAEPISREEAEAFRQRYGAIGDDFKIPVTVKRARASDCYITIEERHTKRQNGFYKVTHYKTTAPYQYIEDYTTDENGESDAQYIKTYNPFVSNRADLDRLAELTERANLTDRQRAFLEAFASRCRLDGDFKSVKAYAFKQIGITTESNQRQFFHRLKIALTTAKRGV